MRRLLKAHTEGPKVINALRFRLALHLEDPDLDPLSSQVWPAYKKLLEYLKPPFSLLDAGCMSGFLYHHLKRTFGEFQYTGVDIWREALQVGRENASVKFIEADMRYGSFEPHDYVVVSNIPFPYGEVNHAVDNLLRFTNRALFLIYPDSRMDFFGPEAESFTTSE